jgi:hypothetical protein
MAPTASWAVRYRERSFEPSSHAASSLVSLVLAGNAEKAPGHVSEEEAGRLAHLERAIDD